MTKSIRKGQKRLRKKAKPQDPHEQSPGYWPRELRDRDRLHDEVERQDGDELFDWAVGNGWE